MEKTVTIGSKAVRMRASALIPRLYRFRFGRDIVADMRQLQKAYQKAVDLPEDATEEQRTDAQLSVLDLTIFENIAFIMAKHADKTIPDEPDDWLDELDGIFSVYEILPVILELWGESNKTTSIPKKN